MSKVNLNKKSVKQQGGQMIPQQPGMQQQPQVDPAIQQISQFFAEAIEQGGQPEEVVINLMQQEVDQNTIAQALMTVGYQEADITALFESVQQMTQPKPANAREVNRNPQELARNQQIAEGQQGPVAVDPIDMAESGIEIKPENKGKFTRWAKSRGMSVSKAANTVMSNTDSYPPSVVKMANFAKNAAGWNKAQEGGEFKPHFMYKGERKIRAKDMATHLRLKEAGYNHEAPTAQFGGGGVASAANAFPVDIIPEEDVGAYSKPDGYTNYPVIDENGKYYGRRNKKTAQDGVEVTDEMITNATVTGADAIDPVITAPSTVKLTPEQVKQNEQMSAFLQASKVDTINGQSLNGTVKQNDEGIIGSTNYFSPNAFKTGNNFSFGKALNVLNEGYTNMFSGKDEDGDGVKDGSFRDWKGKTERNKANKLANTTYDVELDLSQENKNAANAWKTQYDIENPEKDALGNLVEEEAVNLDESGNAIEIQQQPVDAFSSWLNKGAENLQGKALETFNSLKEKYGNKEEEEITVQQYGSEIPKAQFSVPDSGAPFADPMAENVPVGPDQPLSFQEWVMEDPVTRGTADGNTRYQEYVDGFSSNTAGTETIPSLPATELEVPELQDSPMQRSAADMFGDINAPKITANTGGLEGAADRFINSKGMTAFGDVSDFVVKGADVVNDWFEDKNIKDAKDDMRANLNADSIYGTKTDAFNKRGTTDINTGLMGSEGDRTTGLYMSKQGGGINNAGFKALPDFVQHNILSNMSGGGEAAYLANRDRVIKREMAQAQEGVETGKNHPYFKEYLAKFAQEGLTDEKDVEAIMNQMNVTPMDTLMVSGSTDKMNARTKNNFALANFVADDLFNDGSGNFSGVVNNKNKTPYFTSTPDDDGMSWDFARNFYEGDNYKKKGNLVEVLKSKQPNNDASLMKLYGMQQGGETVNVNSEMLAKLIAAGADIEIL